MIYVVLGMHKSGTTLVSQLLHQSGISMGEDFGEGRDYDDAGGEGKWERRESFLIDLEIVGCRERDFFSLDHYEQHPGPTREAILEEMDAMIGSCGARSR
jgi:hypothetical protein